MSDDPVPLLVKFPAPTDPPSTNAAPGTVRARIEQHRDKQAWRDTAAMFARRHPDVRAGLPPAYVRLRIPFRTNRRRDPSNYVGTVTKWVVDGLVLSGAWPDDDPRYVTVIEPELFHATTVHENDVTVTITPRTEGALP